MYDPRSTFLPYRNLVLCPTHVRHERGQKTANKTITFFIKFSASDNFMASENTQQYMKTLVTRIPPFLTSDHRLFYCPPSRLLPPSTLVQTVPVLHLTSHHGALSHDASTLIG